MFSTASAQGMRDQQEDRVSYRITDDATTTLGFVLDGHGGPHVVDYVAERICFRIAEVLPSSDPVKDISDVFENFDRDLYAQLPKDLLECGTTAAGFVRRAEGYHFVNLGDCFVVVIDVAPACLVDGGVVPHTTVLWSSVPHRPSDPKEVMRINAIGGFVSPFILGGGVPRVNGLLGVSRALGDFLMGLKIPGGVASPVSNVPTVTWMPMPEREPYIIVMSDGILDLFAENEPNILTGTRRAGLFLAEALYRALADGTPDLAGRILAMCAAEFPQSIEFDNATILVYEPARAQLPPSV